MPRLHGKQIQLQTIAGDKLELLAVDTGQLAANAVTPAKADLTATWDFSSGLLRATTPIGDTDVANKAYVDAVKTGLDVKDSCRVATDAALPAYVAAGSGVGKTLTASAVGILTVDGVATVLGDRILVKDEAASHVDHGIYEVTTEGTGGVAFVLTRATDADQDAEVTGGMFTFIEEGSANADSGWVLSTNDPIVVDTTALQFVQFSGAGSILAGAGLDKTGNTIFAGDVNKGVQANTDDLQVDASEIAGDALVQRAGGGNEHLLDWDPSPGGGLEVNGGQAQVKVDTVTSDASVAIGANGLRSAVPTVPDKSRAAQATVSDFDAAFAAGGITATPAGDGMVGVRVNGQECEVGDGVKTTECFFSGDGGTTARAIGSIVATDTLHWVGSVAGYQLSGTDVISLDYAAV
jgi:hypothetical protein